MAQGPVKSKSAPKPAKKSKVVKKGKTKVKGIQGSKATRKFTAALVGRTEQLLGERAGHLELVGKGKKTESAVRISGKGGTKKFG